MCLEFFPNLMQNIYHNDDTIRQYGLLKMIYSSNLGPTFNCRREAYKCKSLKEAIILCCWKTCAFDSIAAAPCQPVHCAAPLTWLENLTPPACLTIPKTQSIKQALSISHAPDCGQLLGQALSQAIDLHDLRHVVDCSLWIIQKMWVEKSMATYYREMENLEQLHST